MQDVVVSGLSVLQWWLLGLAAIAGAAGGGLVILLLLYPQRPAGIPGLMPVQGALGAGSAQLATFSANHLLHGLPSPRRFFEQLGPDRFRRELERTLRAGIDGYVDDVMTRRTGNAWDALSSYARARIYSHVQQRLPYVVDDFIERIQRELDGLIKPRHLIERWFATNPNRLAEIFRRIHGTDLYTALLPAMLLPVVLTLPLQWVLPLKMAGWLIGALSATLGAYLVYTALIRCNTGIWSFGRKGILQRHRVRFLEALQRELIRDALGWSAITATMLEGNQAGRIRHMMRREVASILDVPTFRISMQFLLGPSGFAEVKSSAAEKAVELLSVPAPEGGLRERYQQELERTLTPALSRVTDNMWAEVWNGVLLPMRRRVLVIACFSGAALGAATVWLQSAYTL